MKIKYSLFFILIFLSSCDNSEKNQIGEIRKIFSIPQEIQWVLIVNPGTCKTCLENFLSRIHRVNKPDSQGLIFLVVNSQKEIKANHRTDQWGFHVIFDLEKKLIDQGIIQKESELILITPNSKSEFSLERGLDVLNILEEL